jgi:hypothetical protein
MSETLSAGAVYGTVKYGEAYYGRPLQLGNTPLPTFSVAPLTAVALSYTSIQVSWTRPTSGTTLRLVRNSYGFSADENDGLVVSQAAQQQPFFVDLTLSPDQAGQFLYYTVWNQAVTNGAWWRAGDVQVIQPKPWGYGSSLKGLLPAYLFDMDDALVSGQSPVF